MARHTRIFAGPARKNDPQVVEAVAASAILPGSIIGLNGSGEFANVATATAQVWIAQENYLMQRNTETAYAAGDTVMGLEPEDDVMYACLVAATTDVTKGDPLAIGAGGALVAAGATTPVFFFAEETYTVGAEAELVLVRPAGSRNFTTGA